MKQNLYRKIPKVDALLEDSRIIQAIDMQGKNLVMSAITHQLEDIRKVIQGLKEDSDFDFDIDTIIEGILAWLEAKKQVKLRQVINGTGIVVHTNLGRSSLADSVRKQVMAVALNYSTLEFDLSNGKRGSRYAHVEDLICELTGAEAAMVVNNNAAAVMLVLSTMASGKEVIVSRGQLVEIGGSFRIPEVMKLSGAKLVEVGATNKTHLRDYESHITEETALLLKVHTSNFKVMGFTQEVEATELCQLAGQYDLPVYDDLGSGMLVDLSRFGLKKEPTVQESIKDGVDIVSFSGDKMLGGPQAGIIVGKKAYIEQMKKNQLTRALRVDKMTLAALEGTLMLYRNEVQALKQIPTLNMLTMTYEAIAERAALFMGRLGIMDNLTLELVDDYSQVGGGSMPLEKMRTRVLTLAHDRLSSQDLINYFREFDTPIIGRVNDERLILDFRTLSDTDLDQVYQAIQGLSQL